ncbi:hypothetical protein O181_094763 [Austropuccinia psidii MF-1]|uniref:Uncharacterized protein n=1 Tax=Austropuccinia psidii MF-1 TaxID=1389203 RepID=A0A9Q3PAJ8_9BASI|nr:hypothetical protein [Austropuccinia psidii MF-1]
MGTKVELGRKPKLLINGLMSLRDSGKKNLESSKFHSDKDKALPWFFQQKDILTELYHDMSKFMINRKILIQWEGDLENAVKRSKTEQYSAEDIINILEEVTTRTRMGYSRVNLKTRFNTPCKDSVDRNPKKKF